MKNAISSPHLLPPIPSQRPDEKRKLCPAQFTFKAARRWAGSARSLCRPKFLHSANALPRVVTPVLRPPSLFARAVLKNSTFSRTFTPSPNPPPPDEKRNPLPRLLSLTTAPNKKERLCALVPKLCPCIKKEPQALFSHSHSSSNDITHRSASACISGH